MIDLKSFTKILTLFCLLVFLYIVFPDTETTLKVFLKYIIIAYTIVVLLLYNQILSHPPYSSQEAITNHPPSNLLSQANYSEKIKNDYERLNTLVLDMAAKVNEKCISAIFIIDPKNQSFILQSGKSNEFKDSIHINNGTIKKYIKKNKKFHQKDHPKTWDELFHSRSWRGSECAIFNPIYIQNNMVGFLLSKVDHFSLLSDKELSILDCLGQFTSHSLYNLDNLEKRVLGEDSKSVVLDILSNIDFKSDSQNIYNKFKYLLITLFEYDRLTISLRKQNENRRKYDKGLNLTIMLTDGIKDKFAEGTDFPTNGSIHGLPVINGSSFQTTNWQQAYPNMVRFKSDENDDQIYQSIIASPIIVDSESKGSIVLERKRDIKFSEIDLRNLELIGQVLGSSLHWKYEYEKIHINATHDGLSGLLNHQTFKERFRDEIQRAARFQQKMAIMIFDLDKFKNVNDTLGHQYGDYVIQTVSKIMEENVRAVDVVARYGGEEFAVILINTTAVMSNVVAKRIVSNIADYNFSMDGIETRLTISGGMSEYPTHSNEMKTLIEYADKAMYATKGAGGNNISIHNQYEKEDYA